MDSMSAFLMGEANRGKTRMVFDWDRAAEILRLRGAQDASAGLAGDWGCTGGTILTDGKPVPRDDTYTYLASTWAEPQIDVDGEVIDCWRYEDAVPGWDENTYWPESAKQIFSGEEVGS
jgi:hypothetical protein